MLLRSGNKLGDISADVGTKLETGVAQKLVPALSDVGHGVVSAVQGAVTCTVPNVHPVLAHIVEGDRSGLRMFEVSDELAKDPSLFRIGDAPMDFLGDCDCEQLGPGKVMQLNFGVRSHLYPGRWVQTG